MPEKAVPDRVKIKEHRHSIFYRRALFPKRGLDRERSSSTGKGENQNSKLASQELSVLLEKEHFELLKRNFADTCQWEHLYKHMC